VADSALYFPYIEVPEDVSVLRVLLYWDTLGAIIPDGIRRTGTWTEELVEAELVKPIRPGRYVSSSIVIRDLEEILDATLAGPPAAPFFIHKEKTNRDVVELLDERGLVASSSPPVSHRGLYSDDWIAVEGNAAALYMAYLALRISQKHKRAMEPVTDQACYFEVVSGVGTLSTVASLDHLRGAVLRGVLPAPNELVSLKKLVKFKEANRPLLQALRREVEGHVVTCAKEGDPELRRRLAEGFSADLAERAEEVRRRMDESQWPTAQGVVCGLLEGSPGLAAGVATKSVGVSATAAAPILIDWIKSRSPRASSDMPATYAVLAHDHFGETGASRARYRRLDRTLGRRL
jgi:Family of unknown function (DUF6236)